MFILGEILYNAAIISVKTNVNVYVCKHVCVHTFDPPIVIYLNLNKEVNYEMLKKV